MERALPAAATRASAGFARARLRSAVGVHQSSSAAAFSAVAAASIANAAAPDRPKRGTVATGPLAYSPSLPPRQRIQAKASMLLSKVSSSPAALSAAEVVAFVDEGIMVGQLNTIADFLVDLGAAEADCGRTLLPLAALKRLLRAATFQQALEIGDTIATLAFSAPATRLDAELVELYCNLLAGLKQPDHVRAITFSSTVAELSLQGLSIYLAALARNHEPSATRECMRLMLAAEQVPAAMPDVALQALEALSALGSIDINLAFALSMHASAGVPVSKELLTAVTRSLQQHERYKVPLRPVEIDIASLPWAAAAGPIREAQTSAVNLAVPGLHRQSRMDEVMEITRAAIDAGMVIPRTTLQVCKHLLSDINDEIRLHSTQMTKPHEWERRAGTKPDSKEKGGLIPTPTTARYLEALVPLMKALVAWHEAYTKIFKEALHAVLSFGRLPEALSLLNAMMTTPESRQYLSTSHHLNQVLTALLRSGQERHAVVLFERMMAVDHTQYPGMAPDVITFNLFITHAASKGDAAEVKRLMVLMRSYRVRPDGITLSAVTSLRTMPAIRASSAGSSSTATEIDDLAAEVREDLSAPAGGVNASRHASVSSGDGGSGAAASVSFAAPAAEAKTGDQAPDTPRAIRPRFGADAAPMRSDNRPSTEQTAVAADRTQASSIVDDGRQAPSSRNRDTEAELDRTLRRLISASDTSTDRARRSSNELHAWTAIIGGTKGITKAQLNPFTVPFNRVMQGYFTIGAPRKAASVLQALTSQGVIPGPDTVRMFLIGTVLSGVLGDPDVQRRVPPSWGGSLEDSSAKAYYAASHAAKSKARYGRPLMPEDAELLAAARCAEVAQIFAEYRAAVAAAAKEGAGTVASLAAITSSDSPIASKAVFRLSLTPSVLAAAPWLGSAEGRYLATQIQLFSPWDREQAMRLARIEASRKALDTFVGGSSSGGAAASSSNDDLAAVLTNSSPSSGAIVAATSFTADVLDGLTRSAASVRDDSGSSDHGLGDESASLTPGSNSNRSSSVASAAALLDDSGDLLPLLPRTLRHLFEAGIPAERIGRSVEFVVQWMADKVPPHRALAAFLTLYNCGAWGSYLTRSPLVNDLLPQSDVVDVRSVFVPSMALFVHALLSQRALQHLGLAHIAQAVPISGSEGLGGCGTTTTIEGTEPRDLVFAAGTNSKGFLMGQLREVLQADTAPPLPGVLNDTTIVVTRSRMATWLQQERRRLNV